MVYKSYEQALIFSITEERSINLIDPVGIFFDQDHKFSKRSLRQIDFFTKKNIIILNFFELRISVNLGLVKAFQKI